jgi:hypothetical protein
VGVESAHPVIGHDELVVGHVAAVSVPLVLSRRLNTRSQVGLPVC